MLNTQDPHPDNTNDDHLLHIHDDYYHRFRRPDNTDAPADTVDE